MNFGTDRQNEWIPCIGNYKKPVPGKDVQITFIASSGWRFVTFAYWSNRTDSWCVKETTVPSIPGKVVAWKDFDAPYEDDQMEFQL